jgi:hypothetical protein
MFTHGTAAVTAVADAVCGVLRCVDSSGTPFSVTIPYIHCVTDIVLLFFCMMKCSQCCIYVSNEKGGEITKNNGDLSHDDNSQV